MARYDETLQELYCSFADVERPIVVRPWGAWRIALPGGVHHHVTFKTHAEALAKANEIAAQTKEPPC